MAFQKIEPTQLPGNVIDEICNKWMLLAAGTEEASNFMTVNWGMMGELWFQPAVTVYVRHSRHTMEFVESNDCFTLSALKPGHQQALNIAGSKSGRDGDKYEMCGLTPAFVDGCPTFKEAAYTIVCKKMYAAEMDPADVTDEEARTRSYPEGNPDPHKMYIGKIVAAYVNE